MEKVLIIAIVVLYLKWIFITLLYPLEACWGLYQNHKSNKLFKLLAVPSYCIERMLRFGGDRFLIFNISTIPSNHLRRFLYKGLGAHIASKVVFHFRTEIRAPWSLHKSMSLMVKVADFIRQLLIYYGKHKEKFLL